MVEPPIRVWFESLGSPGQSVSLMDGLVAIQTAEDAEQTLAAL